MSLNCFIKALLLFETSKETYVSQAEITHNALKIRKIVKSIKIWVFLKKFLSLCSPLGVLCKTFQNNSKSVDFEA